ncbi:hypothetical protein [Gordonia sp. (in: high G+C Gram-positive bacteria)]|uniref:hypothetical protein n=1 Tax=Gordonia sp. (in: high G+C Gram-positive bacteria) TaxID=84139 RepID=UPI003F9E4A0C
MESVESHDLLLEHPVEKLGTRRQGSPFGTFEPASDVAVAETAVVCVPYIDDAVVRCLERRDLAEVAHTD